MTRLQEVNIIHKAGLLSVIVAGLLAIVNADTFTVGDDFGTWAIPATTNDLNYDDWAAQRNFRFGDELIFRYTTSSHLVLLVNATDFESCFIQNPIEVYASGDDTITLNRPGFRDYYFICGSATHCWLQQKLHVTLQGTIPELEGTPKDSSSNPPPSKSNAPAPPVNVQFLLGLAPILTGILCAAL